MKNVRMLLIGSCSALLVGCGSPRYVDVGQSAPIAIVAFSLDKSIVEDGKERSSGPGLLQKAENYYKNHQIAIDGLWRDFKESYKDIFLGAEVLDVESVASNEEYRNLTKHVPKMVMGTDIASGANYLTANGGLNYVSSTDKALLDKLPGLFNARLLTIIEYTGSYAMSTGISIGKFGAGAAKMKLTARLSLYEPGKGIVLSQLFSADSDESYAMVAGALVSDNYEKGLCSAQRKLLPQIKAFLQTQQSKAKAAAQKA